MAKQPYSTFDDEKLYQKPERRQWNETTGSGWGRIISGPDKGHWQYWHEGAKVPGKIDRSGRMDLFNFSGTGWGKGKPTPIPTEEEKETTPLDGGYGDSLEYTMGFNPENSILAKGLTEAFTKNLDTFYDETDTTNMIDLLSIGYSIGNKDLVSKETGNKGTFWDKLANSFSLPDSNLEPTVPKEETSSNTMKTWKDPYYGDGRDDVIGGRNWDNPVGAEGGGKPSEGDFRMDFPDGTKRLKSAQDYAKAVDDGRWDDMTNWERTQAKVFAKGSPIKRMKIKKAQSTFNNDDLFTKNREK